MLTPKDYCDYDTCVALKELGFNALVDWYFNEDKRIVSSLATYRDTYIPRISLYEAQKWLREEKGIHITIHYIYHLNEHMFGITLRFIGKTLRDHGTLYDTTKYSTYEEALSEGIKEAVRFLKDEQAN